MPCLDHLNQIILDNDDQRKLSFQILDLLFEQKLNPNDAAIAIAVALGTVLEVSDDIDEETVATTIILVREAYATHRDIHNEGLN